MVEKLEDLYDKQYEDSLIKFDYKAKVEKKDSLNPDASCRATLHLHDPKKTLKLESILEWAIENMAELIDYIKKHKAEFREILAKGNVTVISNHFSWGNLVILAYVFHKALDIPYKDFFIIVGPAIIADLERLAGAQAVSNVIQTLPEKMAKENPELKRFMFRLFYTSLKEEVLDKVGKVVFIAPSGTKDRFENGKIIMKNPEEEQGAVNLIRRISKTTHCKVMYVGVNESEIIDENDDPRKGLVYMKSTKPMNVPGNMEEVRNNLKEMVIDKNNQSIGEFA